MSIVRYMCMEASWCSSLGYKCTDLTGWALKISYYTLPEVDTYNYWHYNCSNHNFSDFVDLVGAEDSPVARIIQRTATYSRRLSRMFSIKVEMI